MMIEWRNSVLGVLLCIKELEDFVTKHFELNEQA